MAIESRPTMNEELSWEFSQSMPEYILEDVPDTVQEEELPVFELAVFHAARLSRMERPDCTEDQISQVCLAKREDMWSLCGDSADAVFNVLARRKIVDRHNRAKRASPLRRGSRTIIVMRSKGGIKPLPVSDSLVDDIAALHLDSDWVMLPTPPQSPVSLNS